MRSFERKLISFCSKVSLNICLLSYKKCRMLLGVENYTRVFGDAVTTLILVITVTETFSL